MKKRRAKASGDNQDLYILADLSRRLLATDDLDERLTIALETVTNKIGCRRALIALSNDQGIVKIEAAMGFEEVEPTLAFELPPDRVAAASFSQSLLNPDTATAAVRAVVRGFEFNEEISVLPLIGNDTVARARLLGLMLVDLRGCPGPVNLQLLNLLANIVAGALANAQRDDSDKLAKSYQKLQQAEAQARRERDQLNLILENVGVPIVVCDASLRFILINQRAEALFQAPPDANGQIKERVEANTETFNAFISTLAPDSETLHKTELELIDPQTGARLTHDVISVKISDERASTIVSILHDLTKLRELERRRVEQQLFKSEKMAAIGLMAAQIAHEVNNPLEVIKNSLYLLETTSSVTRQEPQTLRFLEIARKETERVSGIIKQMLGFSRPSNETEPVLVKVNEVIEEVLVLIEKPLKQSRIKTEVRLAPSLPAVFASADQLKQVFLNLIINSQHAMEGGGTLTITTSVQNDMSEEGLINPSVIVEFTDTGIGIDERDLLNIFEPFYSLNKGKKGTGLGLWVSLGIVRSYGGRIKVNSTVGKGSSFYVILPIKTAE